jgi:hypothetical protein
MIKVVSENLEGWLGWREAAERPVPGYVEEELRGYLECGILCFGFGRALLGSTQVEFFSAGERADHRASYVSATLQVKLWFGSFVRSLWSPGVCGGRERP